MIFKINEKKGEITTKQIVTLIILILSFSVILFLIFRLDLGQITNEEICRNSVVLKGQSKLKTGTIDCRTSYVCISGQGGEGCEGINPTKTIEISSKDDDEKRNEILNALAEEMASCWFMFGEGKLNYVGLDIGGYHCPICSIVSFDEETQETFSYRDLFNFLETNKKDNSETYLKYLFDVVKAEDFVSQSEYLTSNYDVPFSLEEKYSIITGRNVEFGEDQIVLVHFIKTSDLDQTLCTDFDITKA